MTIKIEEIPANNAEKFHIDFENYMKKNGLTDLCKHNIINVCKVSNQWGIKELKKIIKYMSFYRPEYNSIFLLYKDNKVKCFGCIEIVDYKGFQQIKRLFKASPCSLINN
ncbi:MAG: hypothetical protein KAJ62_10205 [Desulfobacteraceae bacterium]|nr:hypothetical protein [Desulfobacteraceae bacterium]